MLAARRMMIDRARKTQALGPSIWAGAGLTSQNFQRYDITTNTWDALGTHPNMAAIRQYMMGTLNDLVYVAGGETGSSTAVATVQSFDPTTNTWTTRASLATARSSAAAAVLNGKLYVIGGFVNPSETPTATAVVYNPATDSWSSIASLPGVRFWSVADSYNGKIYVNGGGDSSLLPIGSTVAYDPSANSWTTLAPAPTAVYKAAGGIISGKLHVVGGFSRSTFAVSKLHQVYDVASNTWSSAATLPVGGTGNDWAGGCVYNGQLYYVLGTNNDGSTGTVTTLYRYDPSSNTWTQLASAHGAQAALSAAVTT